jgi:hypothetical protein
MEVAGSSKTSVPIYKIKWCDTPKDHSLNANDIYCMVCIFYMKMNVQKVWKANIYWGNF